MSRRRAPTGFTLIELIVVIAIAATLMGATVVGIGALTGARARATLGELGATVRALYDTAALTGHTCRLVFDLPAGDTTGFAYRAECAARAVTSGDELRHSSYHGLQAPALVGVVPRTGSSACRS